MYNKSCYNWNWLAKNYLDDNGGRKRNSCFSVKGRWTCSKTCWDCCKWHFYLNYNLLPTHPFYLKGWVGFFFWQICVCNTFINYGSQMFAPPSFSMWEGGWGIFSCFKYLSNTLQLCRWYCSFFLLSLILCKFQN